MSEELKPCPFCGGNSSANQSECEALQAENAELREALGNITNHYRLRNLECKYCGEAAIVAQAALEKHKGVEVVEV